MKIQLFDFLVFCVILGSCSEKTERITDSLDYELEIVDSIAIPIMESLRILAIHPDQELFLFEISNENSPLVLVDGDGKVVQKFDVPRDSPNAFGLYSTGAIFIGDTMVIQSQRGLFFYDLEFNFINNLLKPYPSSGAMIYNGSPHLQSATTHKGKSLISFSGSPQNELPSITREFYDSYNTFDLITVETKEFSPILPFHPSSKYQKSGKAFSMISTEFSTKESRLSYVYREDTMLYDVDLLDPKLEIAATSIPFDHFHVKPGFEFGEKEDFLKPQSLWGIIISLQKVGDLDLITYTSGVELENLPARELPRSDFYASLAKLNPIKWIVRNSDKRFSEAKHFPRKFNPGQVDQKNRIWALQNHSILDHEPDHQILYQLKLVQK